MHMHCHTSIAAYKIVDLYHVMYSLDDLFRFDFVSGSANPLNMPRRAPLNRVRVYDRRCVYTIYIYT